MHGSIQQAIRPRVRLRVAEWEKATRARNLPNNAACASLLGTSESTISRVTSGAVEPSQKFIAASLWHFDALTFEQLYEIVVARADQ
ncbi:hypothetical protein ACLQ2R_03390 [Streptosporangium sp. DT93]|uniref:hypothetical protein n=1 Tax=Streptosporangium sp. DT93 TaxID=3393428 RepID=UPI003CF81662